MKRIELERRVQELAGRITDSQLIQNCEELAVNYGEKGRHTPASWSCAREFTYEDATTKIEYRSYAMGDEEVVVSVQGNNVFHAKQDVERPAYPHFVVKADGKTFDILKYIPGDWEQRITENVPEDVLKDVQERFGIFEEQR